MLYKYIGSSRINFKPNTETKQNTHDSKKYVSESVYVLIYISLTTIPIIFT